MYKKDEIAELISRFNEKQRKQFRVEEMPRIIDKLIERNIDDEWIVKTIEQLFEYLRRLENGELTLKKEYQKLFADLKKQIQKKYDLVPKGYYAGMYMSLGLSFGTALGVAFMNTVNTSFLPIGIGAGLSIGVAIGSSKDKDAEAKGLVY